MKGVDARIIACQRWYIKPFSTKDMPKGTAINDFLLSPTLYVSYSPLLCTFPTLHYSVCAYLVNWVQFQSSSILLFPFIIWIGEINYIADSSCSDDVIMAEKVASYHIILQFSEIKIKSSMRRFNIQQTNEIARKGHQLITVFKRIYDCSKETGQVRDIMCYNYSYY